MGSSSPVVEAEILGAVSEILSTLGASIIAQNVIMAAAKLIPFLGWLITISMAYALTYAIGEASGV